MEMKSPPPCPSTVTVRRNPPRKARATPSSAIPFREPLSSASLSRNIFSDEILQNPKNAVDINKNSPPGIIAENLKVFLRIRPLAVQKVSKNVAESKNAWPKNPKIKVNSRPKIKRSSEVCLQVNEDMRSVTVSTPQLLQEMKRIKSEVYEGFTRVFASEVSQTDVYEEMVKPLVEDFLEGKSGMLAAMGPSGSGKTHTVFGYPREPGMVPLTLRGIFRETESTASHKSRAFYLSMFEISSEKGKVERISDLLHDGGEISMQQSVIKGLQEAVVSDAQQAESLVAQGMLKRATAMTNSNSQSSRSQCIINIRLDSTQVGEVDGNSSSSMLTIVDLAGAEREKKTGNQGARLLESNFINNTSMVLGQCLRSLLEHQRNQNKPLQKHYKNSLLTRYLQDYLEGKKRMALILTVKPGVDDYLDTSFLLKQASPFMKIKYKTVEEPVHLTFNKRPSQAFPQARQLKKMKFGDREVSLLDGDIDRGLVLNKCEEISREVIKGCPNLNIKETHDENIDEINVLSDGFVGLGIQEKLCVKRDYSKSNVKTDREYQIMQGLSKALWTVLKQYKEKLEGVKAENCHLKDSLADEKARSLDLDNELNSEKMRGFVLENELKELKCRCTCRKASADVISVSTHNASFNLSQCQIVVSSEENSDISTNYPREMEKTIKEKKPNSSAKDPTLIPAFCSPGTEEHTQQLEVILRSDTKKSNGLEDTRELDICIVDMPSSSQADSQSTSGSVYTSHKSVQDASNIVVGVRPESERVSKGSFECESAESTRDFGDNENTKGLEGISELDMCSRSNQALSASSNSARDLIFHEDSSIVDMPSSSEATSQCVSLYTNHTSKQNAETIEGDVKNSEPERECVLRGFCFPPVEPERTKRTQDSECLKDAKQEPTSPSTSGSLYTIQKTKHDAVNIVEHVKNAETESDVPKESCSDTSLECEIAKDKGLSLVEDRIVLAALNTSESPGKDDTLHYGDEESKLEQLVAALPEEVSDAKKVRKFVPKVVAPCSIFQLTEKPKRRLQPASSVLLKDISLLNIKDENDKPKGVKVGKKTAMDEKNRTPGVYWKHLFIGVTRVTLHVLTDHFVT